jgi:hypothetical protein
VVSGLGGSNWAPVHQFCERRQLPCLFPNVDAPVDRFLTDTTGASAGGRFIAH